MKRAHDQGASQGYFLSVVDHLCGSNPKPSSASARAPGGRVCLIHRGTQPAWWVWGRHLQLALPDSLSQLSLYRRLCTLVGAEARGGAADDGHRSRGPCTLRGCRCVVAELAPGARHGGPSRAAAGPQHGGAVGPILRFAYAQIPRSQVHATALPLSRVHHMPVHSL